MRTARIIPGFTLIEMALVLAIIGILLGGAVMGVNPVIESSKTSTTNSKLDRIELALLAYVMQNGCLPCPANGSQASTVATAGWSQADAGYYGPGYTNSQPCASGSALAGTTCAANQGGGNAVGVVPWNTLGIAEGDITDGWNSRISYAVTSSLAVTAGTSMTRTLPASYPAGTLTVNSNVPSTQTSAAAYVLISYGRDRAFAFSAGNGKTQANPLGITAAQPEGVNSPTIGSGTIFRQDTVNLNQNSPATYFDDIVRYRTAPAIIVDCGPNACGNPAS